MEWRNRTSCLHFLRRATQFGDAATLMEDDLDAYSDVVAVAAVHGAIALVDAILEGFGDGRSRDQNHKTAVVRLTTLCGRNRIPTDGIQHFTKLLSQKTEFSYGDKRLNFERVKAAVVHFQRLLTWSFRNFPISEEKTDEIAS